MRARVVGGRAGRASTLVACALLLGVASVLLVTPTAGATPRGEYPEVPTSEPEGVDATCELQAESLTPGDTASVKVGGVEDGTVVRVYVGSELATEQAVDASNPVVTFIVPDLPEGSYDVTVVGPTFTVTCFTGVQVLGVQVDNPNNGGDGPGGLAVTGLEIGALVLLGLVALAVGLLARRASHQRERAARVR